jgi:homocysteine S-methyltransferase
MQLRAIDFLHQVAQPYDGQVPALMYAGIVGPRGDAYEVNRTITAEEAEEYHSEQLATLARAGVDLVEAMTFNGVPEVIGSARATARVGLPLAVSFTLDSSSRRLASGPTLKDAIETIDTQTGDDRHLEAGDPPMLGELMGGLARQHPHVDIWGGCCGTWETHLDEIAYNVHTARGVGAV